MFSVQQNWRRGQNRFCLEAGVGGGGSEGEEEGGHGTVYTHVSVKMIKRRKEKNVIDIYMFCLHFYHLGYCEGK
jgi:hypothetical protein